VRLGKTYVPALAPDLRRKLETVCVEARDIAEAAARSALQKRAVDVATPFDHFTKEDRDLRNRLRARGRQAGDLRNDKTGTQDIDRLTQELAYEYWHRMLFARFLADNHLLMHPDGVPVSLEECEDLAKSEKAPNGFVLAARYASRMLPQIFHTDDVLLEIEVAPEHRLALERLLASLSLETFLADDSLGWVYQFWQTKRKKEVNDSGDKIDGRTIPAVTQLFTEDYMVQFLLHNTIGAWWCAKEHIKGPPGGAGVPPDKCAVEMPYLRWRADGTPAAGSFEGWPKTLRELTILDPCCGSGHFLVAALTLLIPLRMHDEGLTAQNACDAVLRENLFGLEIDPRCTQIAAFALALAAWKLRDNAGSQIGYRDLPPLHIACTGQSVGGTQSEWLALADNDGALRNGMERLYSLFKKAPDLGSLLDPRFEKADVLAAGFNALHPLLTEALRQHSTNAQLAAIGIAAQGMAKAAELLTLKFTLIATNVPYLSYGSHAPAISDYLGAHYESGKSDIATAFMLRCRRFAQNGGTISLVTPQNWLYGDYFQAFRKDILRSVQLRVVCLLGAGAFSAISGEVVKPQLIICDVILPVDGSNVVYGLDLNPKKGAEAKSAALLRSRLQEAVQHSLTATDGSPISFAAPLSGEPLANYVHYSNGIQSGDYPRFGRQFWERPAVSGGWSLQQTTAAQSGLVGGLHNMLFWENGKGEFVRFVRERLTGQNEGSWIRGLDFLGKNGVAISPTGTIKAAGFWGTLFDDNTIVLIPKNEKHLLPVLAFCLSDQYGEAVRALDKALKVRGALVKVNFDLSHWQTRAKEIFPKGILTATVSDPTQWTFQGDVAESLHPLQVAIAQLLGYAWPHQMGGMSKNIERDGDGIVALSSVRNEGVAAERISGMLSQCYGSRWSENILQTLLNKVGCKPGTNLGEWLRDGFFEDHCSLFHNRPFIWHIWDGRKDGFSCFVNYHRLNHKSLENLAYSYLGEWIKTHAGEAKAGKVGADLRLAAAQALQERLTLILAGEPPYDIFVRWKPLSEQAIGWYPDLNDGVRLNIRPFVQAGILRKSPNIKWTKDRGAEPERPKDEYPWFWKGSTFVGDRVNDIHLNIPEKQAARRRAKR
jgi:hypothetical protein